MNNKAYLYRLKLGIVTVMGCLGSLPLFSQPDADFTASQTSGCSPVSVDFQDQSSGNVNSYLWDFGNGNTSTKANPSAIYTQPGTYTVELTVTNNNGQDTETKQDYITIYATPQADFTVSDQDGCIPKTINFTDQSQEGSGTIDKWTWDLGDGTVLNQENPSHQYTSDGSYDVSLVIEDVHGCTDDVTKSSLIDLTQKPTADFSAGDSVACDAPLQIDFTEQAQSFAGNLGYEWDFGDGNTSSQSSPTHTYQNNGIYDVTLKVTDTAGCQDSITKSNYVIVEEEKADFSVSDKSGCAPHETTFSNLSAPNIPGSTYEWHFGNGKISQDKNPTHEYQKPGNYTVTLIVKHQNCKDSLVKQDAITVYPEPNIDFSANETTACESPFQVDFSTSGDKGIIQNWNWDFGDGNTANTSDPTHTYNSDGNYSVALAATDTAGCQATLEKSGFVKIQPPKASFKRKPKGGCIPLTVEFTNESNSVDPIKTYDWDFDNGNSSTTEDPVHTFTQKGKFNVKLTITTDQGCIDSVKRTVEAGKKTNPDFKADKRVGCLEAMQDVQFTSLTNDAAPLADSFNWRFGDGGEAKVENPTHDYEYDSDTHSEDSLDVRLISFQNKCPDTLKKQNYIVIEPPWANFTDSSVVCNEDSVFFKNLSHGYDSVKWEFGDGSTSSEFNPVHHYSHPDLYDVKLTVWNDSNSCKDEITKSVAVSAPFQATFTVDNPIGCAPHKVTFTGNVNESADLQWDFGNGQTSQQIKNEITYTRPDTYDVQFTAISEDNGCEKTVDMNSAVVVNGTEVDVSTDTAKGCTPLEVTASGTVSSNNEIKESHWDFGNGDTTNFDSTPVTYTYESPPLDQEAGYDLSLVTVDEAGCYDTGTVNIQPLEPQPEIAYNTTPYCDSVEYQFHQKEEDEVGLGPFDYQWDFSPGSNYNQESVYRTFSRDQKLQISLTLEDAEGCTNSEILEFNFNARELTAGFTADTTYGDCPPLEVNFQDTSQAGYTPISKWQWDFGDGSQSKNQDPQKLYLLPGQYTVELVVEDTIGCIDTFTGPDYIVLDGPTGDYSFSPTEGCSPLDVTLEAETRGASRIQWDLGDGNVKEGSNLTHTYKRSTQYIPLLILSDTTGCTYALPPKDTINVDPSPNAGFEVDDFCFNYPTRFTDTSKAPQSTLEGQFWKFEDNETARAQNPNYTYESPGYYQVKHAVENGYGCWDTVAQTIDIGGLEVFFDVTDTAACQERSLQFFDQTFADTAIASRQWSFGDGDSSDVKNPFKTYEDTGFFDVGLAVTDVEGCSDTLEKERFVGVGDTAPPEVPGIYRASVVESDRISLVFGEYEDFDIRHYEIFRKRADQNSFQLIDQIAGKKDTQYVDHGVDPINHAYCYKIRVISYCDRASDLDSSTAHCTIELTAEPDTNRALLDWNPYQGWDSVARYLVKRERLYNEGQYLTIDTVPGTQTSYIDSGIACYKRHRYQVTALEGGGNRQFSNSDTSGARPVYIPDVPANQLRRATVVDNEDVKLEWTNPPKTPVEYYHIAKSVEGDQYELIREEVTSDTLSFVDPKTDVQNENYYYKVRVEDTCGDIGDYSNFGRSILLNTTVNEDNRPVLEWTPYLEWENGVDYYEVELQQPDGSFEVIDQVDATTLTYLDQKTDLNQLPAYVYRVTAHEAGNNDSTTFSVSNESEVEGVSSLHVANAFTPDGDGVNDEFAPEGIYIDQFHMEIYSRWGEFLYETDNMNEGWDGTFKGQDCQMDAYIYIIEAIGIDGKPHHRKGDVTLLR